MGYAAKLPRWTCSRSGDCCLTTALVVTTQELAAMHEASPLRPATEPMDGGFVKVLTPEGCPYLTREVDGKAACGIYEARPTNCRRFVCLRPDPATEPYEVGGPLGCRNLSRRVDESWDALMFYRSNERRAMQTWGHAHGWRKETS